MAQHYDPYADPRIAYEEHATQSPAFIRETQHQTNQPTSNSPHGNTTYPTLKYRYSGDSRFGLLVMLNAIVMFINVFITPVLVGAVLVTTVMTFVAGIESGATDQTAQDFWAIFAVAGASAIFALVLFLINLVLDAYTVIAAAIDAKRWRKFRGLIGTAGILALLSWLLPLIFIAVLWGISELASTPEEAFAWGTGILFLSIGLLGVMRLVLFVLGIVRMASADFIANFPADHPALDEAWSKGIDIDTPRSGTMTPTLANPLL